MHLPAQFQFILRKAIEHFFYDIDIDTGQLVVIIYVKVRCQCAACYSFDHFFSPESDAEPPSAEDDAAEPLLLPALADALLPHPAKLAKRPAAANTAQNFFVFS